MIQAVLAKKAAQAVAGALAPHLIEAVKDRISQPRPQPASPAADAHDALEQLRKLGELRDAGVLTDAEFEAKKQELLRRI